MIPGMPVDLTKIIPSYLTIAAAAVVLCVDPSTVLRWIRGGKLRAHVPVQAPGERPLYLLWEADVIRFDAARKVVAGAAPGLDPDSDPDPCAGGCSDPAAHAEGGHDV